MHSSGLSSSFPSFRLLPSLFVALPSGVTIRPSLPGLVPGMWPLLGCTWPPYIYPKAKNQPKTLSLHSFVCRLQKCEGLSSWGPPPAQIGLPCHLVPSEAWQAWAPCSSWWLVPPDWVGITLHMTLPLHNRLISPSPQRRTGSP